MLPGCYEYHLLLWGGAAAGIVQPLNPMLTEEKLAALMNASGAKVLVAWGEGDAWAKAQRVKALVPTLAHLLRVGGEGAGDFAALVAQQPGEGLASGRDIAPEDIAAYFHTGGTTGSPKLARHSHGAQVFTAWACVKMQGMTAADSSINGYPLFHVAGVLPGALTSFAAGAEQIIPTHALFRNKEVIANYWKLVAKLRPTVLTGVPTILAALCEVPVDGADISSLRYCRTGAAVLSPELAARFERQFGLHVHESLGMTEMAGISTVTPPGLAAPAGCVGLRLPFTRMRIVALDDQGRATDREVPPGEPGMVQFQSPNVFSGFVDPADNAGVLTPDGWLATGDLGWVDEEERLRLSGRSKDLIIRGGHNIDPKVIEDALGAHPAVQLCAAVGAPDAYAGELPVAFVTLVPGAAATEAELLAFAATRVDEPPAKPKWVAILPAMPMTTVGKIFKPELRELAAQRARSGG
jgi:fatty-acyl-CoA synthase